MQRWNDAQGIQDRLHNLTYLMIRQNATKPPVLKSTAAVIRHLAPFALELSADFCSNADTEEEGAKVGSEELAKLYTSLSSDRLCEEIATRCALAVVGLAKLNPARWRVQPKLHLLQELAAEGGRPASSWTYRDEDWGGTAYDCATRRGPPLAVPGFSRTVLQRFMVQHMVVLL